MMFKPGSDDGKVQIVNGIPEHHTVGIAHADPPDRIGFSVHFQGEVSQLGNFHGSGEGGGIQGGPAHVHTDGAYLTIPEEQLQVLDAAVGLHGDVFAAQIPQIIQVFAHAADVVARQLAQTAVFVEAAHFHICHRGMLHEHNSVAADAIVGAAQTDAQGLRGGDAAVKVLDEDIVVAGAVHLGEGDFPPPQPHGVDVHQLGVALVVAAEGHVCQSLGGVQGSQAGNAQLHGLPMQGNVVTHGGILHRSGVDDVAQLPGLHQGVNPVAFRGVGHGGNRNAQGGNGLGGAFCGIEGQTQIIEPLGQGDHFRVVSGLHAEQHPGGFAGVQVRHGEACGGESLEHGLPQGPADAQHFAG